MYNLQKIGGTLKGEIGELVFVQSKKYTHRTKSNNPEWIEKIPLIIPDIHKRFIKQYWNTFDAFKFVLEEDTVTNVIFYEIKTTNNPSKKLILTHNSRDFYRLAQSKGYIVKSIYVYFLHNWNIEIIEKEFNESYYTIHDGNPAFAKPRMRVKLK